MTHSHQPTSLLKNVAITAILAGVVFWLGHESSERGVFKLKRDEQNGLSVATAPAETPGNEPGPTSTPLPSEFPNVAENDIGSEKTSFQSLSEAYAACWNSQHMREHDAEVPPDGEITPIEAELLFGRIKKREVLEKTKREEKLGLLFDDAVFPLGAAGSATEVDGRFKQLRLRAAGRMLHCESPNRCECL